MEKDKKRAPLGSIDLAGLVDFRTVFGRTAPLEVEIGAGQGGFAIGHAQAHPEIDLVALEIRAKQAGWIEDRRRRAGLSNLLVVHGDAKTILPRMLAPGTVDVLHIQFPDPWWKRRHHGRRLVEDEFSILLYRLLRVGGVLEVRTDVPARGEEMAEALEAVGFRNLFGPGGLAPRDPDEVPSTRERGYLERGQPISRYRFTRDETAPRRADAPVRTRVYTPHRRK